jgi:ribonuclease R
VEIPIDGLIPVERLPQDRYHFDRETHTLEGYRTGNRFRLGDELIVRIEKVDLARRQLLFRLEKVTHHAKLPSFSKGKSKRTSPPASQRFGERQSKRPGKKKRRR